MFYILLHRALVDESYTALQLQKCYGYLTSPDEKLEPSLLLTRAPSSILRGSIVERLSPGYSFDLYLSCHKDCVQWASPDEISWSLLPS